MQKYNKYKKRHEKDQQTIKSFHKLYCKILQGSFFDKNEYESLCNIFTKYMEESKNESLLINMNIK